MSFDQYHEPPEELSADVRTFARMILSLIEEAQAIDWYEQRMHVEKDKTATQDDTKFTEAELNKMIEASQRRIEEIETAKTQEVMAV